MGKQGNRQGETDALGDKAKADGQAIADDLGLMTVEQLAAALDKAPQTIRNMVARREIPFVTLGNRTVFLRESVRKWLTEKEFNPMLLRERERQEMYQKKRNRKP